MERFKGEVLITPSPRTDLVVSCLLATVALAPFSVTLSAPLTMALAPDGYAKLTVIWYGFSTQFQTPLKTTDGHLHIKRLPQ